MNQYLWTDEAVSFYAAKAILQHGIPVFDSGLIYWSAPVYHYILAAFMALLGESNLATRIMNVFFIAIISILIYTTLKKESKLFAIFGVLAFQTLNFSVVILRLTRMYALFSLLYLLSVLTLGKVINSKNKVKIFRKIEIDPFWTIILALMILISFETNGLIVTLFFSSFFIGLLIFIKFRKAEGLLYMLGSLVVLLSGSIIIFHTFNIFYAYFTASTLDWANNLSRDPLVYIKIINNNFAFFWPTFILTPIILALTKNRNKMIFITALLASLMFISYQQQFQERYLYFLIPIIIICLFYSIKYYFNIVKEDKLQKFILILIFFTLFLTQIGLFYKEIMEVDSYTHNSLSKEKKYQFKTAIEYVDMALDENDSIIVLSDWHSFLTLKKEGIDSSFVILPKGDYKINISESDPYFGIPYIVQGSDEYYQVINNKSVVVVVRDWWKFESFDSNLRLVNISVTPKIYDNF